MNGALREGKGVTHGGEAPAMPQFFPFNLLSGADRLSALKAISIQQPVQLLPLPALSIKVTDKTVENYTPTPRHHVSSLSFSMAGDKGSDSNCCESSEKGDATSASYALTGNKRPEFRAAVKIAHPAQQGTT